jgi:hypothetical protein
LERGRPEGRQIKDLKTKVIAISAGKAAMVLSLLRQSAKESVISYIASQESHHRKMTFQEEFRSLLEKHGIAFDERYVWD